MFKFKPMELYTLLLNCPCRLSKVKFVDSVAHELGHSYRRRTFTQPIELNEYITYISGAFPSEKWHNFWFTRQCKQDFG